jgi:hypothetical protein
VYLRGSLALGDFDPATSDIDFLVAVRAPLSAGECEALAALHMRLTELPNPFARRTEGSVFDVGALRRFQPHERWHFSVGTDRQPMWMAHGPSWILERWIVRERGFVLRGVDPKRLIPPISDGAIRAAVRDELRQRVAHWAGRDEPPQWLLPRYFQAYETETTCRALCTLATGELPSKPRAVAWALTALPERWQPLIERSRLIRADQQPETETAPEVMAFARWAATDAQGIQAGGRF